MPTLEAVYGSVCREEGFLGGIRGCIGVRKHTKAEVVDAGLVSKDQPVEGGKVPTPGRLDVSGLDIVALSGCLFRHFGSSIAEVGSGIGGQGSVWRSIRGQVFLKACSRADPRPPIP